MTREEFRTFKFNAKTKVREIGENECYPVLSVNYDSGMIEFGSHESGRQQWQIHYTEAEVTN